LYTSRRALATVPPLRPSFKLEAITRKPEPLNLVLDDDLDHLESVEYQNEGLVSEKNLFPYR
jgi:hypothetical protein